MSNVGHYRITIDYFQYMNEFKPKNQSHQIKCIESSNNISHMMFINVNIIDI